MPWKAMVKICQEEQVISVVDAAHSLGQEISIDLRDSSPDFWTSSCNKWFYAKRGCAVLYVPKRNQHIVKTTILPAVIYPSPSGETTSAFVSQFFWSGTVDVVPPLSVSAAIKFRSYIGGEQKIISYCHSLAIEGGKALAEVMGTSVMDSDETEGQLIASMVNVQLPLSGDVTPTPMIYEIFHHDLLVEHKIFGAFFYHDCKWWVRASAQVFNEVDDFRRLGKALLTICAKISGIYL